MLVVLAEFNVLRAQGDISISKKMNYYLNISKQKQENER
jgi:hypothetical protein